MILMRKQILREFKWVVQVTLLGLTLHLSFYDKSLLLSVEHPTFAQL